MCTDTEIKMLILELMQELDKMSIQEIRDDQKESDAKLKEMNVSDRVRNYCSNIYEVVIRNKQEKEAGICHL